MYLYMNMDIGIDTDTDTDTDTVTNISAMTPGIVAKNRMIDRIFFESMPLPFTGQSMKNMCMVEQN